MVDVASIIVAVIGLVAGLTSVLVTAYFNWRSDERRRIAESEKLLSKYRDPLLLSCQDLQARLYNIVDKDITGYFSQGGEKKENLLLYTAFLVGQYLSWTHILRRQVQFLRFEVDEKNKKLAGLLSHITHVFGSDRPSWGHGDGDGKPFMLLKAHQTAIGEAMTVADNNGQMFCMGYATFHKQWYENLGCASLGGVDRAGEITGTGVNGMADPRITTTSYTVQNLQVAESHQGNGENRTVAANGTGKHREYEWNNDFRRWFRPLVEGVAEISIAKNKRRSSIPDQRVRYLQHLLLDLIRLLDEKDVRSEAWDTKPCGRAEQCTCSECPRSRFGNSDDAC